MNLRPYQSESIKLLRESLSKNKRVILCLPTGAGKTVVFSEMAWKSFVKGKKVMILTHRKELLKQAGKINSCEIAMVETLNNRIKKGTVDINSYDLLIIDEAHIGSFKKILSIYTGYIIGATATPLTKPSLSLLYNEIVCNIDIPQLIDQGFLAKPRTFVKTTIDVSKLETRAGEFTDESMDKAYNKAVVFEGMVNDYVQGYNGKKAIVFCVNIAHCINVHQEFLRQGVYAYLVHSKMPDRERDEAIDNFSRSKGCVLVNAGIATTGFDCPDIELVIINRATQSLPLWLQMVGRGSRTTKTKKDFTILDYGENVIRLGHWEAERNWREIFFKKKKQKEGAAPVKVCPSCTAICFASARICPHCLTPFDISTVIEPPPVGELVELIYRQVEGKRIYELEYGELFEVAKAKGWKQGFVERVLYSKDRNLLVKFWDSKNYKQAYRERKIMQFSEESPPKNFYIKK